MRKDSYQLIWTSIKLAATLIFTLAALLQKSQIENFKMVGER